jgi:hypothetical protein
MTERIDNQQNLLFQVHLLHHYWLDDGATVFDLMPSQDARDNRLLSYDRRPFLAIAPTVSTAKVLAGLRATYKDTALGCLVAVPNDTVLPVGTVLEFVVTVQDGAFNNYSALTMRGQNIREIYYQPEDTIYRYKENVAVLSNLTGTSRGTGANKALFLSREFPALAADDQVEALFSAAGALSQLTGDQPGAGIQQLSALATDLPVFLNQGDLPAIVPPPGLTGAPQRGIPLSADLPDQIYALIRLSATPGSDFSFIDNNGKALAAYPTFQVRFKNRSTVRNYFQKTTGAFLSAETAPLPLTYFGNAGSKQKPSDGFVKAVKNGSQITQLVSEIFI